MKVFSECFDVYEREVYFSRHVLMICFIFAANGEREIKKHYDD